MLSTLVKGGRPSKPQPVLPSDGSFPSSDATGVPKRWSGLLRGAFRSGVQSREILSYPMVDSVTTVRQLPQLSR